MSITLTYKRFFTVRVKEQGSNKPIRSLRFSPTQKCQDVLSRYQLVFKQQDNGFDVYYKSYPTASTPVPTPIEDKIKFTFGLKIIDPAFQTKYEPDTVEIPQFYLDNLKTDGGISPGQNLTASTKLDSADLAFLKQQSFSIKTALPGGANNPTEWQIKEKFGSNTLQTNTIDIPTSPAMPFVYTSINNPITQKADYLAEEGPYIFKTNKASPPTATIYLSNEIKQKAVNGVLDIYWNSIQSNVPADTGKEYQIIIKPK